MVEMEKRERKEISQKQINRYHNNNIYIFFKNVFYRISFIPQSIFTYRLFNNPE